MKNSILVFGILLVAFALTDARCAGRCQAGVRSRSVCLIGDGANKCRKIRGCQLREENCARQRNGKSLLQPVNMSVCLHISGHTGTGRCAPRKDTCQLLRCTDSKQLQCYRSRNLCRRLTTCESQRQNCRRHPANQLRRAHKSRCRGMKRGANWSACKPQI